MVTISSESGLARLKKKFRAEVGPGKTYWRVRPFDPFRAADLDLVDNKITGVAIYLSPEDFEHLCVLLSMDETDSSSRQYAEYFETVSYEAHMRKNHPSIEEAWEAYQIMLAMARPNND